MRGVAATGDKKVSPQAPAQGVLMPVYLAGLTDVEVRASLAKMTHAITMQAQDIIIQVNRKNVQRENPPVRNMADKQREFTRMNPPIFTGSKTTEDPQGVSSEVC